MPASGKLTVAKALLRQVPGRLLDNHAAIDLARTVFDFGDPGFWSLVHKVRMAALDAAAAGGVPLMVTTTCYSEPEDRPLFEEIEATVQRHGGEILPVFLGCSAEEAARRVDNPDRKQRGKLTSVEGLNAFLARWTMARVPRADCLTLASDTLAPEEAAARIVRHFNLTQ